MRHVKVRTTEEARSPELVQLVRDAWQDGRDSVAKLHHRSHPERDLVDGGSLFMTHASHRHAQHLAP